MVLSFSRAAEAMMFSVGWQAVEMTTSAGRKGVQTGYMGDRDVAFFRFFFTCVALQLLHDLLRLQVPDVNHVVLGARHDPLREKSLVSPHPKKTTKTPRAYLPASDGEIGEYAVLLVLVARVGFQALSHSKGKRFLETFLVIE